MSDDWGNDPLVAVKPVTTPADHSDWGNDPLVSSPSDYSKFMKGQTGKPLPWYQRFKTGLGDVIYGGAQLGARMTDEGAPYDPVAQEKRAADVDALVKKREADYQAARQGAGQIGTDWWRIGGNVVGTLPTAAFNPVAAGVLSAAVQPVTEGDFVTEKAKQVGLGAVGGKVAQVGGNALAKFVAAPVVKAISEAAQKARDAGYVLLPSMLGEKAGPVSNLLAGWGGKIKTQQGASVRNQEVTNNLAKKALGLPEDAELTEKTFNEVRGKAAQAYKAIPEAMPQVSADEAFGNTISGLGQRSSQAAQHFPGLMKNPEIDTLRTELGAVKEFPTQAGLDLVRELRHSANANLKAIGDPQKHALGLAQREAADAVDGLIERNLDKIGKPGMADAYREARKTIAKAHDVESVTNTATGDVNARGLAKLKDKGRPLSGELDTIADVASAFPKATQNTAGFGGDEPHSVLDVAASAAALAHGNPVIASGFWTRPIARNMLLSNRYQNMLAPTTQSLAARAPQAALISPQTRNYLADIIRRTAPYAAPGAGVLAEQAAGP